MSYPPQSGGPGDGVVIPVSSLPTHEGAEIARLRALIETIRGERDKFSRAVDVMHAQQMRTEAERDLAQAEVVRLRQVGKQVLLAITTWDTGMSAMQTRSLTDALQSIVNERTLP